MGVVITREDIRAYAEVNYIINHMNEKYREKVPEKLKTFFNEYKDPTCEIKINPYVPLQNQGLQRYTLEGEEEILFCFVVDTFGEYKVYCWEFENDYLRITVEF